MALFLHRLKRIEASITAQEVTAKKVSVARIGVARIFDWGAQTTNHMQ